MAIDETVAFGMVVMYLSGLRDYPLHEPGQKCLARHLAQCALSVGHAEAVLETFRHICPTPQEIHDAAWDEKKREAFLPPAKPIKEQWEEQGYTYDKSFYDQIRFKMPMRAPGQPREIDLMYKAVKDQIRDRPWEKISWGEVWSRARDLGFPLNTEQKEDAARWESTQPKRETRQPAAERKVANGGPEPRAITRADIDAARRKRAADSKGGDDGREDDER